MTSVFILTGNYIAPKYKNTISIILFGLLLFFIGGAVFSVMGNNTFLDEKVEFQIGGLPTIMSVLGAFYGLYEARKINKEDDDF